MLVARPTVSVIVGSHNARATIEPCLVRLLGQRAGDDVEIVVSDNSTDGTTDIVRRGFPEAKLVLSPPSALIPELWTAGIRQSHGGIVALTTAHCVPAKDWIAAIRAAHETEAAAVGGAIESDEGSALVDWAIYFCRYSQFMLPFLAGFVPEVAADNASYKRIHLDPCADAWRDGFWEPAVHARLRRAGLTLWLTPSVVVYYRTSYGFRGFVKQRFQHGRQYGRDRSAQLSAAARVRYVALSPLIPAILLARIARQVWRKRRHRWELVLCLPVLVAFVLAWSSGELLGYAGGRRG